MSEDDLKDAVLENAALFGWLVHHDRPARVMKAGVETWRTNIEGDKGFPDLVLVHAAHGVLFRELKSEKGLVSPEQQDWLNRITGGGGNAGVWRPTDWTSGVIERTLRGERS